MNLNAAASRLWAKVAMCVDPCSCWEWNGYRNPQGYGRLSVNRVFIMAHRLSYLLTSGPIPDGMYVCHRCDNPSCVRPSHLFLGTPLDNIIDCRNKGRRPQHKHSSCLHGHERNALNAYPRRNGTGCRECDRRRKREYRLRLRSNRQGEINV